MVTHCLSTLTQLNEIHHPVGGINQPQNKPIKGPLRPVLSDPKYANKCKIASEDRSFAFLFLTHSWVNPGDALDSAWKKGRRPWCWRKGLGALHGLWYRREAPEYVWRGRVWGCFMSVKQKRKMVSWKNLDFWGWITSEFNPDLPSFSSVQSLSRVRLFATPWTAPCQASLLSVVILGWCWELSFSVDTFGFNS